MKFQWGMAGRWRGASAPAYGGWREAPCREAAMHRSKNEEPTASVSSHNWRWREALRHGP